MPELPEVECLTRAVRRVLKGGRLVGAEFFRKDLRDPIPIEQFKALLVGQPVEDVFRRSKYMVVRTPRGMGVFHLGMTGNIIQRPGAVPDVAHTHAVFAIEDKSGKASYLHFIDPRRFGRIDCIEGLGIDEHPWFSELGPEPLEEKALGAHLFQESRGRKQPVKAFLMDARVVVGVGNIYASESLFRAGIHPLRKAGSVSSQRYARLGEAVRETLKDAIKAGGTTFRDFKNSDGNPGYFALKLAVYDREGDACTRCGGVIEQVRLAGRSTFFCGTCQS